MIFPPLYAVVDHGVALNYGWRVPQLAKAYLEGGARLLQIRAVGVHSGALLAWCDEVIEAARSYGALVIVNDRADVARMSGAAGVHIGQADLQISAVRQLLPEGAIVGLSTHSKEQVDQAARQAVGYVAVGPVYDTTTKATGYRAVGLELVQIAANLRPRWPVVGIGGITLESAGDVFRVGGSAVAVISDLLVGGDPAQRVRDYIDALAPFEK